MLLIHHHVAAEMENKQSSITRLSHPGVKTESGSTAGPAAVLVVQMTPI